jgi:beta-ribofuranosylaminobenzene 5'-phosphate synthase
MDEHSNHLQPCWTIVCPARLHFGLLEICPGEPNLFGGLGVAIDQPQTRATLDVLGPHGKPSVVIECHDDLRPGIESIIHRALTNLPIDDPLRRYTFHLRIVDHPKRHNGVGSGTQLACAVASLIQASIQPSKLSEPLSLATLWNTDDSDSSGENKSIENLARASGRGLRSCVGLAAHLYGGLIVDHGVQTSDQPRRVTERIAVPEDWPVLLIDPKEGERISGTRESSLFALCSHPNPNRARMQNLATTEIATAVQKRDFPRFASALFEYGCLGGKIFEAAQGGVYRDHQVGNLVSLVRSLGAQAIGQTSWGPTVFCIVEHDDTADEIVKELSKRQNSSYEIRTTRMTNQSATLTRGPQEVNRAV